MAVVKPPPEAVAIILARGGSKGIPRKNLATVAGIPLVSRAVRAAASASTVAEVYVSTDDGEIATVAEAAGAKVVRRPASLCTDESASEAGLEHALDQLEMPRPRVCVLVQATSPFLTGDDVDGVVELVESGNADSAFTAVSSHSFLWRPTRQGVTGVNHDFHTRSRRQDLGPEFVETGGAYAMLVDGFLQHRHRFFGTVAAFDIGDRWRSLEVDDPGDLLLAEALATTLTADTLPLADVRSRTLVVDFDGVMTDNRALVLDDGSEGVFVSRSDGMGLAALLKGGWRVLVLSKERNPVVQRRADKLGVECAQGIDDKWPHLKEWLRTNAISPNNVVYVGNDVNDNECMRNVGFAVAVNDAWSSTRASADLVLRNPGGHGALRELAESLMRLEAPEPAFPFMPATSDPRLEC